MSSLLAIRTRHRCALLCGIALVALVACGDDPAPVTAPPDSTSAPTTTAAPSPTTTSTSTTPTTDAPTTSEPAPTTTSPRTDESTDGSSAEVTSTHEAIPAIPGLVELGESDLGTIVTDATGLTLYLFTPDEAGEPTCTGGCAGTWPPYIVDPDADLTAGDGIDPALLSLVEHPDGGMQLRIGTWPAYYFAGDEFVPGATNGQGTGDSRFVIAADGSAIR